MSFLIAAEPFFKAPVIITTTNKAVAKEQFANIGQIYSSIHEGKLRNSPLYCMVMTDNPRSADII